MTNVTTVSTRKQALRLGSLHGTQAALSYEGDLPHPEEKVWMGAALLAAVTLNVPDRWTAAFACSYEMAASKLTARILARVAARVETRATALRSSAATATLNAKESS